MFDNQWATVITASFHIYMCVNFCEPTFMIAHGQLVKTTQLMAYSQWTKLGEYVCVCALVQVCVGVRVSVCARLPPLSMNTCKLSGSAGWIWAIVLAGRVVLIKTALCQPSPRSTLPLQLLIAPAPTLPPNKFAVTLPAIWPWIGSK